MVEWRGRPGSLRVQILLFKSVMTRKRVLLIIETSREYGRGLMGGISRYALEHGGWQIHFDDRGLLEEPSDWLRRWQGDGIISRTATPTLARILSHKKCPMVELHGFGLYEDKVTSFSEVQICNRSIAAMAAGHFLERGFRQIGFYSCGNTWWARDRVGHFTTILRDNGVECHVYSDRFEKTTTQHTVWQNRYEKPLRKWLQSLPKPVGVWAITDHQAVRVLEACRDLGFRVPEDVAILGTSNDTLICNLISPPLSSVDVNSPMIGYEAARRLEMKMSGQTPPEPYLNIPPLQIVTRQSTDMIAIPDPDIAEALHLIRQRALAGVTVAEVAGTVGISRRTLERRFEKHLGRSPHDEIVRVKIDHAKTLLRTTSLSISAIAHKTGFTNREYFIYAFHRETGTAPKQFRTDSGATEVS